MISRSLVRAMTSGRDRGAAVYESIMKTLSDGLQPTHIELVDDSKAHQGEQCSNANKQVAADEGADSGHAGMQGKVRHKGLLVFKWCA
jgi:stress-induced morphogen